MSKRPQFEAHGPGLKAMVPKVPSSFSVVSTAVPAKRLRVSTRSIRRIRRTSVSAVEISVHVKQYTVA